MNYVKSAWQENKVIILAFSILLLTIPIGIFVISWRMKASTDQPGIQEYNRTVTFESTPSAEKKSVFEPNPVKNSMSPKSSPSNQSPNQSLSSGVQVNFGPTMDFILNIEGRPDTDYSAKAFVGIAQGQPASSPQYLLSFTVDVPISGVFNGLSLAGLNQGTTYTAYIKTPAQIATASAFTVSPTTTKLNAGAALKLISGDLNEDNVINSADYSIAKAALGSNPNSKNWNSNVDFNLDGLINTLDISLIIKNIGKTGISGAWYSPNATASGSALMNQPASLGTFQAEESLVKPPSLESGGYWIWVPPAD